MNQREITGLGKRIATSKVGWFLVVLHLSLVLYRFIPYVKFEGDCSLSSHAAGHIYIAGDYFHFFYEDAWFQILLMLDMPALMVSDFVLNMFSSFGWCEFTQSWILAVLWLVFASIQWFMLGYLSQEIYRRSHGNR